MSKRVAIVIPVYKNTLNENEAKSLAQCKKVLHQYPIIFVAPKSLDAEFLTNDDQVERFDDAYFKSPKTYNKLLINPLFYERFIAYEFMLIHQLDAYVFKDELEKWCDKGYDYIGAPKLKLKFLKEENPFIMPIFEPILFNGGFSLRRIKPIIKFLKVYNTFIPAWPANEDSLFSIYHKRAFPLRFMLKLPTWKEGLSFAFEKNPQISYGLQGESLPFGCHAWEKYNPSFWKKFII